MNVDMFSNSMLGGADEMLGGWASSLRRFRAKSTASPYRATYNPAPLSNASPTSGWGYTGAYKPLPAPAPVKLRAVTRIPEGIKTRPMRYKSVLQFSNMKGIRGRPDSFMNGDELGGWLTDLTKPVSRVVRDASSSALGVVRTGVKAAAPALVSAITGRPVNVQDGSAGAGASAGAPYYVAGGQDKTLLYAGLGGAALLVVLLATRGKK